MNNIAIRKILDKIIIELFCLYKKREKFFLDLGKIKREMKKNKINEKTKKWREKKRKFNKFRNKQMKRNKYKLCKYKIIVLEQKFPKL